MVAAGFVVVVELADTAFDGSGFVELTELVELLTVVAGLGALLVAMVEMEVDEAAVWLVRLEVFGLLLIVDIDGCVELLVRFSSLASDFVSAADCAVALTACLVSGSTISRGLRSRF